MSDKQAQDLLLEIGCEELPTGSLLPLSQALADLFSKEIKAANLSFSTMKTFVTPRRIALIINQLDNQQASQLIERQGPALSAAFDQEGKPTPACLGFAKSCETTVDKLQTKQTPKGERLYYQVKRAGQATQSLLPAMLEKVVQQLPIKKPMRWNANSFSFVRPVHWLVFLFGDEVIQMSLFGCASSPYSHGHRFHHPERILISSIDEYEKVLHTPGHVIVDFKQRQASIAEKLTQAVDKDKKVLIDTELLMEVTALVEWPVVLIGQFKQEFLAVPKEVLITSMQTHQKFFPIVDQKEQLQAQFALVSNIDSENPQVVIEGNQRVLNARLADAAFFYHNDCEQSLASRTEGLKHIIYQKQLGSLADKVKRLAQLTVFIAELIGVDSQQAERVAALAKCDLLSELVGEFPSLQGTMGYYYALNDGEAEAVALAIKEHYQPRFSKDDLPSSLLGSAIALVDRLDALVGIMGINQRPTGDKDPFALRRAALGVLRIIIEKQLPLDLNDLLQQAYEAYQVELPNREVIGETFAFMMSRLKAWYLEQGVKPEIFEAVLANQPTAPYDFHRRLKAVEAFQDLPEASALAAANKRVSNILRKQGGGQIAANIDLALMDHKAERHLADLLSRHQERVSELYSQADYGHALAELSSLKGSVDSFFEEVMIMVDDSKVRANRLALLSSLHQLFTQVADISLLPS